MWGRDFYAGVGYSVLPPWGAAGQPAEPSRAAAKAATDGLRRRLIDCAEHARVDLHQLDEEGAASSEGGGVRSLWGKKKRPELCV